MIMNGTSPQPSPSQGARPSRQVAADVVAAAADVVAAAAAVVVEAAVVVVAEAAVVGVEAAVAADSVRASREVGLPAESSALGLRRCRWLVGRPSGPRLGSRTAWLG